MCLMRTRWGSACLRPSWRAPNSPALPWMPMDMNRSSPRYFCQCRVLTRFFPRRASKMECKRCCQWAGSLRVPWAVSMTHPRTSLRVTQDPSPLSSFLTEAASWHWVLFYNNDLVGQMGLFRKILQDIVQVILSANGWDNHIDSPFVDDCFGRLYLYRL